MATIVKKERKDKWRDDFYVKAHALAKAGWGDGKIANALGVDDDTFRRWRKKRPALEEALLSARSGANGVESFHEYVYKQLPDHLRRLWDKINKCSRERNGVSRVEALLENAGLRARQHLFLYALVNANFNPSAACRAVNITKKTFDNWKNYDPDFLELVDEIDWHKGNFFEGALVMLVKEGNAPAVLFANKTFNAKRGYADKGDSTVIHNHLHAVVNVDDLNLPLETRKALLDAMRAKREGRVVDALPLPEYTGVTPE